MEKKKLNFIAFILWLVLAICWTGLVFSDIIRADTSGSQTIMHVLFMAASYIISFAEYKKYKNHKE